VLRGVAPAGRVKRAWWPLGPPRSEEDTERLTQLAIDLSEYLTTGIPTGTLSTLT
jgi:hypothetical protein